jgi:hypothetical protein
MRTGLLAAFAVILVALSACIVEPYGDGRGNHYHDDGHRVWRE